MTQQSTNSSFQYEHETKDPNSGLWIVLVIIALIVGAFIFLRTEASDIGSADELSALLADGQPKVLEFYSNY